MTAEAKATAKRWLFEVGKYAGALTAIGAVLAVIGGLALGAARGWVVGVAKAQTAEVTREGREAQARINRQTAEAIDQLTDEMREARKDTRAFYATMRQFTGIRSDRLDKPLPPPPAPDGGP